jgi:4a-hydroxytetrahydrobiopterin dehydratase
MILTPEQIQTKLNSMRGWGYIDGQLQRTYTFQDFRTAMELVNKVAVVAEQQNHHPDISIRYNKVTFAVSTHDEDGVTDKDFALIKEIDNLVIGYI